MIQARQYGSLGRWGCGIALLLLLLVIAFAPGDAHAAPPVSTVLMRNNTFQPQALTVHTGTTVTWINKDQVETHNVIEADGVFASTDLTVNLMYQWTPTQAGIYDYYCSYHGGMTGTITVLDAPPPATATPIPEPPRHANAAVATVTATSVPVPPTHIATPTRVNTPGAQPARH